jgi:hypothetical protein
MPPSTTSPAVQVQVQQQRSHHHDAALSKNRGFAAPTAEGEQGGERRDSA